MLLEHTGLPGARMTGLDGFEGAIERQSDMS